MKMEAHCNYALCCVLVRLKTYVTGFTLYYWCYYNDYYILYCGAIYWSRECHRYTGVLSFDKAGHACWLRLHPLHCLYPPSRCLPRQLRPAWISSVVLDKRFVVFSCRLLFFIGSAKTGLGKTVPRPSTHTHAIQTYIAGGFLWWVPPRLQTTGRQAMALTPPLFLEVCWF
jgi:hypothetical protein